MTDKNLQEKANGNMSPLPLIPDITIDKKPTTLSDKRAKVSSSQFGFIVFLAGVMLIFACSLKVTRTTKTDLQIFLIILMLVQMFWMLLYILISDSKKWGLKEKDAHAGARWLRCGIALFAVMTLIMDSLDFAYFLGYSQCMPVTEGIYQVTHFIHTVFQVYFLWYHSKDVILSFKSLERFGLILSVFTNLLLWTSAVAIESESQLLEHMGRLSSLGFVNISRAENRPECNCTNNLCGSFSKGVFYTYPFNIEYHILASTMLFVLWKNIGNKIKYHQKKMVFKFHYVLPGAILGFVVLAVTIGVLVTYFLKIGYSKHNSELALLIYYLYSIIVLSIMCVASVIGLSLFKVENNSVGEDKSPTIKLDADLLIGAACGSWIIAWGSILAIIFAQSHPTYTWYNLPYSILIIIEKYVQNLFIIKYIYCKNGKTTANVISNTEISSIPNEMNSQVELTGTESYNEDTSSMQHIIQTSPALEDKETFHKATIVENVSLKDLDIISKDKPMMNQVHYLVSQIPNNEDISMKLNSKKIIMKNITVFLFMCNIALWLSPAFGCRPQYDNGLEALVFGFEPWIIVIDIALPFSVFYRMHSAYSLFDVYSTI
ncbi:proton channel OTOP1-like [Bombina bombina]|uniref:proton channel OTOP1-like n=1 Tax=Bombina bombina TaxID=8345 RepID=UPI00235AC212|nr:proton channel OTOP1-like [Bombina bombina]